MTRLCNWLLALGCAAPATAAAHDWTDVPGGSLVSVAVEVEGRDAPLFAAPDASGRFYVEARKGARYALRLSNRTHERLGVAVTVDGLDVVSGERSPRPRPRSGPAAGAPGRMYILDPGDTATIRGWRTSLDEVRRFTFVDEQSSYAARSGKANSRMGWIEVGVYRERTRGVRVRPHPGPEHETARRGDEARTQDAPEPPAGAEAAPHAEGAGRTGRAAGEVERDHVADLQEAPKAARPSHRRESYPGTGWGPRAHDRAVLVSFDPQPAAAERITLRYEYGHALRALGILPPRPHGPDRLAERERGAGGFAKPPRW